VQHIFQLAAALNIAAGLINKGIATHLAFLPVTLPANLYGQPATPDKRYIFSDKR